MQIFNKTKNKIILGDCLEVMKKMETESIDLIYLDPPFFSNRNYEVIWGDEGEIRSFQDRWTEGIDQYIRWLFERVEQMHRLLKPTGSIYLHCDWHANAEIKVYILNKLFGKNNFKNEIDWCYNVGGKSKIQFARKKDTIYWYSKGKEWIFNRKDITINMTPHKHCNSGKSYGGKMGIDEDGREYVEKQGSKDSKGNYKYYRYYLDEGKVPEDWWIDINSLQSGSSERIGYPTQKPLALLERIIKASSNENDVVLDPFMGGGTTLVMASRLGRKYIGIDQSVAAVDVTNNRLKADGMFTEFEIEKYYYAEEDLRAMNGLVFEKFIVDKFGGTPNTKQIGDFGLDGYKDGVPLQVKNHKNKTGRVDIDKFYSSIRRDRNFDKNKQEGICGYFISWEFAKEAVGELARLQREENVIIEKVLVSDIVPVAKKPVVEITCEKTEDGKYKFTAMSDSPIINYSWDFEYGVPAHKHPEETAKFNPTVLYDKTGMRPHNFATSGSHNIAVKVVDDKLLENMAVITISI